MRRICVVTGTRADFGLLRWVMHDIAASPALALQLVVTGTHLAAGYGDTWREIEDAGFRADARVEMLVAGDSGVAMTKSMALALIGFADAFERLQCDVVLVLGDRYEALAAAQAALLARIPVAHVHGGELSAGALDDAMRHAITKLSHLHFVAAAPYAARVRQLGEDPTLVFEVGGLGVDAITRATLPTRRELEVSLGFALGQRPLLVTLHPVTAAGDAASDAAELLAALEPLSDATLIFTLPNADSGGHAIRECITNFAARHSNAHVVASMGQQRWLASLRESAGVIGNSSSGLLEAPTFRVGTVNIGARQDGRLRASSVIDAQCERHAIAAAIAQLASPVFQVTLATTVNPYGDGGAAARIVDVLETVSLHGLLQKTFVDLPVAVEVPA